MGEFKPTPSQERAIHIKNGPVLVSAAAGSGKTRVLTERLMARVLAGEDIDRFLVITFTRAAAAELRGRIMQRLGDPGDKRLRRQRALVYRAQIGTIDSFCTALVRENAHALGVSPSFTVLDEDRAQTMRARALEDVLDRAYERIEADAGLRALVDSAGAGRDDSRLAALILDLDSKMQSYAFPKQWAAEKLALLDTAGMTDAGETDWGRYLLSDAIAEAEYRAAELERTRAEMLRPENAPFTGGYPDSFADMALLLRDLSRAAQDGWEPARAVLDRPVPKLRTMKRGAPESLKARFKPAWDGTRDALARLRKTLAGDSAALLAGLAASKAPLTALMDLVWELEDEYAARKRRADACDFSDVEHFCVQLLDDPALAAAVSDRFAEVMVDEYQDVNAVQERIFQRVSHEGRSLFMVGDVKQSIYRFRLAEPAIFQAKYHAFADGIVGKRILLRENFRSRKTVLDACNSVFSRIMSRDLGEIDYDGDAALVYGAPDYDPAGDVRPELCILEPENADAEQTPDKLRQEAQYVASRIRSMVENKEPVSDGNGGTRPVRYGDIALLLRTPGTSGAAYRRALREAGVPVSARQGGSFFAQPEVSFTLSMLSVLDNPRQDVPLIAALRGLPFGFTPDELSAIRAAGKGDLWDALQTRAQSDARCASFTALVHRLRSFALEASTDSLLRRLYDETELLTVCGVMADASRRIADLMQLYEYARRFEQDGNRGLFRFVLWLRELERRGLEPPAPAEENAVQIMSVHKSKGLEWPVVFLADNSHGWNRQRGAQALCHRELGLGMQLTDAVRGVRWPTLAWRAIDRRTQLEELSEQERVLYVAMTRAREKLIMTCVQPKAAEKLASYGPASHEPVSPRTLMRAQNVTAWLLAAAAGDGGETLDVRPVPPAQAQAAEGENAPRPIPAGDPALTAEIAERLNWRYPYEAAVALPSKVTATGIADLAPDSADPEAAELPHKARSGMGKLRLPDFGRSSRPLTGPERGVAAHLVMQHIDFAHVSTAEDIAGQIKRMEALGFLEPRQASAADPDDILAFFRSDLGARLLGADKVVREFKFSLLCPAQRWYPQAPAGEQILLQGVVDCCMEEAGQLTVVDFKTDATIDPDRYAPQLSAYAAAMERIFQKPVGQAALWYLRRREMVLIPIKNSCVFPGPVLL